MFHLGQVDKDPVGFPDGPVVKNPPANAGEAADLGSISGSRRSPGGGNGDPLQATHLPGKFHGQRSLVRFSLCSHKESDMTKHACMQISTL